MTLNDTVTGMTSDDYKERFKAEYNQLVIRATKLKDLINRIEVSYVTGTEEPKHDCPLDLLRDQYSYMTSYQTVLEKRAIVEDIELNVEA